MAKKADKRNLEEKVIEYLLKLEERVTKLENVSKRVRLGRH